jgi:hypothetical protein
MDLSLRSLPNHPIVQSRNRGRLRRDGPPTRERPRSGTAAIRRERPLVRETASHAREWPRSPCSRGMDLSLRSLPNHPIVQSRNHSIAAACGGTGRPRGNGLARERPPFGGNGRSCGNGLALRLVNGRVHFVHPGRIARCRSAATQSVAQSLNRAITQSRPPAAGRAAHAGTAWLTLVNGRVHFVHPGRIARCRSAATQIGRDWGDER